MFDWSENKEDGKWEGENKRNLDERGVWLEWFWGR